MAAPNSFPLVRGKMVRVTKLDECYNPTASDDCDQVTNPPNPPQKYVSYISTAGVISIALTANIDEGEEVSVKNMDGAICVQDTPCPKFLGYNVEFTFCQVNPCLFTMLTGQPVVLDAPVFPATEGTNPIGIRMNTARDACASPFALEMWTGIPAAACPAGATAGAYGYLLLPAVRPGVIGDFTVENNSITFTVTGAVTKDGNNFGNTTVVQPSPPSPPLDPRANIRGLWGVSNGPVKADGSYPPRLMSQFLDENDHLHLEYTNQAPPPDSQGCKCFLWDPADPLGNDGNPLPG